MEFLVNVSEIGWEENFRYKKSTIERVVHKAILNGNTGSISEDLISTDCDEAAVVMRVHY